MHSHQINLNFRLKRNNVVTCGFHIRRAKRRKMNKLDFSTIKLISSSQVINDVKGVVKELIENAIDADSNCIDVKIEKSGISKIEVADNGCGIPREHLKVVCKPYFTNKISKIEDLNSLRTLGFRGEALYSLCSSSDLTITSRTEEDSTSTVYSFNNSGEIVETHLSHRNIGTIVTVKNLFKNLPVRRQYYKNTKNQKEEFKRIEDLLRSYSFIYPRIRWTFFIDKTKVWQKNRSSNLLYSIRECFDHDLSNELTEININKEDFKVSGYIPRKDGDVQRVGRSIGDRIYISVNKRPVLIPEIKKSCRKIHERLFVFPRQIRLLLKELFGEHCNKNRTHQKYPFAVLQFDVPPSSIDVNLEPNKTKIFLHNKEEILVKLKEILQTIYGGFLTSDQNNTSTSLPDDAPKIDDVDITIDHPNNTPTGEQSEITIENPHNVSNGYDLEAWSRGDIPFLKPTTLLTPSSMQKRKVESENSNTNKAKKQRKSMGDASSSSQNKSLRPALNFFKQPKLLTTENRRTEGRAHVPDFQFNLNNIKKDYQNFIMELSSSESATTTNLVCSGLNGRPTLAVLRNGNFLYIVDKERLYEKRQLEEMMVNHCFKRKELDQPICLTKETIGHKSFEMLCNMEKISSERCTGHVNFQKNGFVIKKQTGDKDCTEQFVCTHISNDIPGYGITDLREILESMTNDLNGFAATTALTRSNRNLKIPRSKKATEWIKNEATRHHISNAIENSTCEVLSDVLGIVKKNTVLSSNLFCPHGNIIIKKLDIVLPEN